jgi:hypothetical protein
MNNATQTTNTTDVASLEGFAHAMAQLCLALTSPSYTADNRDRFIAAVHWFLSEFGEDLPLFLWLSAIRLTMGREPTTDEWVSLELPDLSPTTEANAKAIGRMVKERAMEIGLGPDWRELVRDPDTVGVGGDN